MTQNDRREQVGAANTRADERFRLSEQQARQVLDLENEDDYETSSSR